MAELLRFPLGEEPDPAGMDRETLREYLESVRQKIAQLDGQEPADMEGPDYDAWADRHEELEDLADEILDLLEETEGGR